MIFILILFILAWHTCALDTVALSHPPLFSLQTALFRLLSLDCSLQTALFFPLVIRPLFSSTFSVTVAICVLTIYTNMRIVRSRRGRDAY